MNSTNNLETWEVIKDFYKETFGFEPSMVDLVVDLDILMMCARGGSNQSISKFTKIDVDDIKSVIDKYFGFTGWESDLPFSPLKIYDGLDTKDIESFRNVAVISYGYLEGSLLDLTYNVAIMASRLKGLTDEKWI